MNLRAKTLTICGFVGILATIIISSLCISDWSGITKGAFAAVLWSEIVFFGGLVFVEWISTRTNQIMTRASLYAIITIYALINIIISFIYIGLFKESTTSFAIIQVILFALAAISIAISLAASKSVQKSNEQTMKAVVNSEAMIARLRKLADCPECEQYASTLKTLSDDLRFTDISKVVEEDVEISNTISTIETEIKYINEVGNIDNSTTHDKISPALARLKTLIYQRKISVSAVNTGKI